MASEQNSFLALRDAITSDAELRDGIIQLGKGGDALALASDMGYEVSLDDVKPALKSLAGASDGTLPLAQGSDGTLPLKTLLARHLVLASALSGLAERGDTEIDLGSGTLPLAATGTLPLRASDGSWPFLKMAFGWGVGNG